jgi:hypothetical protein
VELGAALNLEDRSLSQRFLRGICEAQRVWRAVSLAVTPVSG